MASAAVLRSLAFLEEHAAWMERFAEDVKDTYLVDSCVVS